MLPEDHKEAIEETLLRTQDVKLKARWAYFSGAHPKIYLTPKLRETFRGLSDSLIENYCGLAINSRTARLQVEAWDGVGADAAEQAWTSGGFPQRQDVLYRWALVHGSCNLIVQDGVITANPATISYAKPDPNDWLSVAWAGKAMEEDGRWYVTLWDETHLYRYATTSADKERRSLPAAGNFTLMENGAEPHGYQQVPAFPMYPYGYQGAPLIDQISPVQDRINKLVSNKFVAAEFGAFKQRVFFTRQQLDPHAVRQQPDHAIVLDPGDAEGRTSVQELGATDLGNYGNAISAEIDALFTIASLPRHMRVNPGSPPSGDAIKADEMPFVESLFDHQREFGEAIIAAMKLIGIEATPLWREVEARNEMNNATTVATLVNAGIPWQALAPKYLGFTPDEVAEATMLAQATANVEMDRMTQQTAALLSNPTLLPPTEF